jgi:hypothetical protein
MKFLKSLIITGSFALLIQACIKDKFDGLQQNPNGPLPNQVREELLLNTVQLGFNNLFQTLSNRGMELTRMTLLGSSTYGVAYSPSNFDGVWSTAYTSVIKNADEVLKTAPSKQLWRHAGMANVLKAYTYMMLVDNFGDVIFTDANKGDQGITNPKFTPAKQVYAGALVLLDSAIAQLSRTPSAAVPVIDLYYSSGTAWRTLAKTLKLRAYINTRLDNATASTTAINALLAEDDLIKTDAADFTFKYGNRFLNPNTRHPDYNANYRPSGGATGYIGNYFMYSVAVKKGLGTSFDPRTRYYFFRQSSFVYPSEDFISCYFTARPAHYPAAPYPYCYVSSGQFWGRDHGDNSGVPPDNGLRTVWGVYPAGGRYQDAFASVNSNSGGLGAGISPIWMSSFTDFVKAEAVLKLGVAGDAKALLLSAVRKSINRVIGFPLSIGYAFNTSTVPAQTTIDNYVNYIGSQYDLAAGNAEKQLDLILNEYYIALWGNGIEAYNMYRRTSRPRDFQPMLNAAPGTFIRSFFYPSSSVNLNLNATQKPNMGVKIFWDKNPDPLF